MFRFFTVFYLFNTVWHYIWWAKIKECFNFAIHRKWVRQGCVGLYINFLYLNMLKRFLLTIGCRVELCIHFHSSIQFTQFNFSYFILLLSLFFFNFFHQLDQFRLRWFSVWLWYDLISISPEICWTLYFLLFFILHAQRFCRNLELSVIHESHLRPLYEQPVESV